MTNLVRSILEEGLKEGLYSRAVIRGFTVEGNVFNESVGDAGGSSIFDLASITKVFTSFMVATIRDAGGITGEENVAFLLGLGEDTHLSRVNVEHLLSHNSGLPAWAPLYEGLLGRSSGPVSKSEAKEVVLKRIQEIEPIGAPGERIVYSDLGYILLGFVVEAVAGAALDEVLERSVASPLGLLDTCYLPCAKIPHCDSGRIVSTGFCDVRMREKVGEVDDLNCAALGGVAGHAGIFSSPHDLEKFGRYLLSAFAEEVVENRDGPLTYLLREVEDVEGNCRFLGFDAVSGSDSLAGEGCSLLTAGHLGWTGTSMWLDFAAGSGVVLLSDRVAVGGERRKFNELRKRVHTEAWRVLNGG